MFCKIFIVCLNGDQGLVEGAILCFRNLYFYFWHGENTSTAGQLTSPASQKSNDLNKVPLLLQDLGCNTKCNTNAQKWFFESKTIIEKILYFGQTCPLKWIKSGKK